MTNRQYVAVQFKPWDRRTYTYHNDGEPVAIGDSVLVTTACGQSTVKVTALPEGVPSFETKAIDGLAPEERDALDDGDDADLEASREDR